MQTIKHAIQSLNNSSVSPDEQLRNWKSQIRSETRSIDREIRKIQTAEQKVVKEARLAAKKNELEVVRILVREIRQARLGVKKLSLCKTHLNSIVLQLQSSIIQQKITGHVQKSTEILSLMNSMVSIGSISDFAQKFSDELTRAGLIEEMVNDAFETSTTDNLDSEVEKEVNQIINEFMSEKLHTKSTGIKTLNVVNDLENEQEKVVSDSEEETELSARIKALQR